MRTKNAPRVLSRHGYKLTPQRLAVLDVISRSGEHLTPAAIYNKVRPGVGLTSVYRTLDILTRLKLIDRVHLGAGCRSYAVRGEGHRHNLICTQCGRVVEFEGCELDELTRRLSRKTGFQIQGHLLQFVGRCRDCQKKT